ncbi:HNH endonuclease [Aneurinibacillus soli]|uniref:HNH endonuclease n=1 Tax=Aneurinibacillus soli TaxID=1500254 RepID=A0A0U5AYY2_9BACL|nr:HNH endonuclease signature motif containing protein [Aneurinibacillus soli]PYE62971.1 HNH endonuclease [Aneurinibacillus soli]BAU28970.1 HNH endonuclease [Aneurinibacillus soli]
MFLARNPLCKECQAEGNTVVAEVVDHIIPHKGDHVLFWDEKNWQPLCKRHHDSKTAKEDGGFGNYIPLSMDKSDGGGAGKG